MVLAVDDPSVQGAERPPGAPLPPVFDQGPPPAPDQRWRCASCYHSRFKTMQFGMNEPGVTTCAACGKPQAEGGWSIWMHYDDLPKGWQRTVANRYGPRILSLLRTKWRGCNFVAVDDPDTPPGI